MIALQQVSKRFAPGAWALQQIDLRVEPGEVLIVAGPSGAGKSTLLRTLIDQHRPDHGTVEIGGRNITRLQTSSLPYLRRNVGFVFQDFKLIGHESALQNVSLRLEILGFSRREARAKSLAMLEQLDLAHLARQRVSTLSGGEQQRVAIARALVGAPAVILADEPTGNLDLMQTERTLRLLDAQARRGAAVIVATHDPVVPQLLPFSELVRLNQGAIGERVAGKRQTATSPRRNESTSAPLVLHPIEARP
jgi:cell division transport system ATP-binding protein